MSRSSFQGALAVLALAFVSTSLGCWEQVSREWFPQMKRQIAVQPFEANTMLPDHPQGLTPPDGTVPVGDAGDPDLAKMGMAQQDAVPNPVDATFASLQRGEELFQRYCATCHGAEGAGNGPVAGLPFGSGPFGLVLPIGGPTSVAKALTDGHIYTTISIGRGRMPAYQRITPEDRWNVVNYVRELNRQGGSQ